MMLAIMQLCMMLNPITAVNVDACYVEDSVFVASNQSAISRWDYVYSSSEGIWPEREIPPGYYGGHDQNYLGGNSNCTIEDIGRDENGNPVVSGYCYSYESDVGARK